MHEGLPGLSPIIVLCNLLQNQLAGRYLLGSFPARVLFTNVYKHVSTSGAQTHDQEILSPALFH